MTAFIGPSGCGKSTVSKLLLGLYPIDEGTIAVLGNIMGSMTNRELREHFAYVPQEPYLFEGSVRENIRMGKLDASEEEIVRAARMANAHEFIRKLEKGYDTQVGERGNRLSGGQRQRIAIARALIRDPKIIVLDEATSALDSISEKMIQEAINNLVKGRTTFIVAHRLSTIRDADRIAVIADGRCVEFGTFEELMALRGAFYRMKVLQS